MNPMEDFDAAQSVVLSVPDLLRLMHSAGGGLAAGNAALSNSLASQTRTIQDQSDQMRALMAEYMALAKRLGDMERENAELRKWEAEHAFRTRQWETQISLARDAMVRDRETKTEMLQLVKGAATTMMAVHGGEILGALGTPKLSEAPSKGAAKAPSRPAEPEPSTLGETLQAAVKRLSPETLSAILEQAERPNPQLPGNAATLVVVAQIIAGSLEEETLDRIKNEVGLELLGRMFAFVQK